MEEKKYHVDFEPKSATEIIRMARDVDSDFDSGEIFQTSVAAKILRNHGHQVGNATEIQSALPPLK